MSANLSRFSSLLLLVMAACSSTPEQEESDEGSTTTGPSLECSPPAGCEGVSLPDGDLLRGWFSQDAQGTYLFASKPGTACGNIRPENCTNCGNFSSAEVDLPAELSPNQIVPIGLGAGEARVGCAQSFTDCQGNGEDGVFEAVGQVQIFEVTETCITGSITDDDYDCDGLSFAVARCG